MKHRFMCLACMLLSACSGGTVKQTLGLDRSAPDEFRVVSRPPLSVPPEFNLRPPSATDSGPASPPASLQAQSLVTGKNINSDTISEAAKTTGEAAFLKNAGADKADASVREKLVEERISRQQQVEEAPWWDIMAKKPEKADPMVNAQGEKERIEKNKEANKPITEGDTPEVKGRDRGVLGRIFGD
jgi:hypothetical protein